MTSIRGSLLRATAARGPARLVALVVLVAIGCRNPNGHSIRVDRASFAAVLGEEQTRRVEDALADVLARHPDDFPQPPPVSIVLRVVPPAKRDDVINSISWGGVHMEEGRAIVEVHPDALAGPRALNDAELRSLVGHEVVHGYQCVRGPCEKSSPELWRREIEAFSWELDNMGEGTRPEYREDTRSNLEMFRELSRGLTPGDPG